ncbi:S1C family serine protease [Pontibacillus marinus]|uniref:Serine protease n=1 Tax=Pontibacillus marinus BH030004 = DSM 16465 TaxID=1385511 RepID=A0A0A5GIM5_9BACI|nr:trypsin-like peptidase domain-containing protein [Pontibacillus marinus]KGX91874.1 hypothetical protein N783_00345 [Pontibacillus marinus BH030004 = DSM 16465]
MRNLYIILSIIFLVPLILGTAGTVDAETIEWKDMEQKEVVPAYKKWTIQFSAPIAPSSFTSENVFVYNSDGKRVIGTKLSLSDDRMKGYISAPKGGYIKGDYELIINEKVKGSRKGKAIKDPVSFTFHVEPEKIAIQQLMDQSSEGVVIVKGYNEHGEYIKQGSGFSIANGLILTNFHVVRGTKSVKIQTQSGKVVPIEGIVSMAEEFDLALLKPEENLNLPQLHLGNFEEVEVGEKVYAIGSPQGLMNTVSEGIVSGLRYQQVDTSLFDIINIIQTTTPISSGSSGGPLFNQYGKVIGVTTSGYQTGNLNFAVATSGFAKLWERTNSRYELDEIEVLDVDLTSDKYIDEQQPTGNKVDETPEPIVSTFSIPDIMTNVIQHPTEPVVYGVGVENEIIKVNLETEEVQTLSVDHTPERLYFANDELYVTLLKEEHDAMWWEEDQKGAFAVVEPESFTIKQKVDIALDPFDLVATEDHVYISSGSGQHTSMVSYNRSNGYKEVDRTDIYQYHFLEIDEALQQIYAIDWDISPTMKAYPYNNGSFEDNYRKPHHDKDFNLDEKMVLTSDGTYLINASGQVFTTSTHQERNLEPVTTIEPFDEIRLDPSQNQFFISQEDQIIAFDEKTMMLQDRYYLREKPDSFFRTEQGLYTMKQRKVEGSNIPHMVFHKFEYH